MSPRQILVADWWHNCHSKAYLSTMLRHSSCDVTHGEQLGFTARPTLRQPPNRALKTLWSRMGSWVRSRYLFPLIFGGKAAGDTNCCPIALC